MTRFPSMKPEAVRKRRSRDRARRKAIAADVVRGWDAQERRLCVYDRTTPHADLCEFDALGMDIIEGRI